ncbi:MAG: cell division protein ZapA [Acetobacteraceae bacterium]|nr:cell division protein ZapA [Acetobacteraceae bacterium]
MALVTVTINGYPYSAGCEGGQEEHLRQMAVEVDRRVQYLKTLVGQGGQGGEAEVLVLAALLLADEVHDLRQEADQALMSTSSVRGGEAQLSRRLNKIAARAEEIAKNLEHP